MRAHRVVAAALLVTVAAACATTASAPPVPFAYPARLSLADSLRLAPGLSGGPEFPAAERRRGEGANLLSVFVIDSAGRVEPGSITFTGQGAAGFRKSVCKVLRTLTFTRPDREVPGVRTVGVMPWKFEIVLTPSFQEETVRPDDLKQRIRQKGLAATIDELEDARGCG